MCGCKDNKNFVSLPHLKIYLIMANYSVKKTYKGTGTSFYGGYFVRWNDATQEELAHIYEEIDGGKLYVDKIEKTNQSNEKSTVKEANKKSKSVKKDD